jgi:hypothetical protein
MLKQLGMKEWSSRISRPRILWELTNQMFTQPDAGLPVGCNAGRYITPFDR